LNDDWSGPPLRRCVTIPKAPRREPHRERGKQRDQNGECREEIMAKGNNSQRKETKKPKKDKK